MAPLPQRVAEQSRGQMVDQHRQIVAALLGADLTNHHAYGTSATFRAAIDNFAVMLPAMVEGMLTASVREDRIRENRTAAMALDNSRRVIFTDGQFLPAKPE